MNLFKMGFRPFFLFAGVFAVAGMAQWTLIYSGLIKFNPVNLSVIQWHSHEMIFGYALAVIAGFLLTSVRNWTGQQTAVGSPLGWLLVLWVASRFAFAVGDSLVITGVLSNIAFMIGFIGNISIRIFQVRQWRQGGILVVLVLLTLSEIAVLAGLLRGQSGIVSFAIYFAFYLIVLLILIMGRRVTPFFIERGVGYPCTLKQSRLLDIMVIAGFALYACSVLAAFQPQLAAAFALITFFVQGLRLVNWHTPGIWGKPLLWSLYLSLVWVDVGLLMAGLTPWLHISRYLVLHAFAIGGIGFVTLSMMSRVSLGHTGRDVHNPPQIVSTSLVLIILAAFARVVLPIFWPETYAVWIVLSQLLWITAFVLFLIQYLPILIAPRVDGRPG